MVLSLLLANISRLLKDIVSSIYLLKQLFIEKGLSINDNNFFSFLIYVIARLVRSAYGMRVSVVLSISKRLCTLRHVRDKIYTLHSIHILCVP